jgi:tetratricopeptide (TPR) repeat protein
VTGLVVAILSIGIPAASFVVWPLAARRHGDQLLSPPPDAREVLRERKHAALRALRELAFEHEAGHVSDADYAELRARYEADAATVLAELDRLGPAPAETPRRRITVRSTSSPWRHPAVLAASSLALIAFGVALGVSLVRYTSPEPGAGPPTPGARSLAALPPPEAGSGGPSIRPLPPEMLQGMLQAARASLSAGRYGEAIAAYQAVLKRDPKNVDAMTHLALIVAIGGHADTALETLDRALAIDANYPPALLYRGQVLYEAKKDLPGAIRSWERFVAVVPAGEERDRVLKMIADVKTQAGGRR